jgi:hypothetical protein
MRLSTTRHSSASVFSHDHGRPPHEITGLPLRAVHELEHFDDTMGLLDLHHRHTP